MPPRRPLSRTLPPSRHEAAVRFSETACIMKATFRVVAIKERKRCWFTTVPVSIYRRFDRWLRPGPAIEEICEQIQLSALSVRAALACRRGRLRSSARSSRKCARSSYSRAIEPTRTMNMLRRRAPASAAALGFSASAGNGLHSAGSLCKSNSCSFSRTAAQD